MAFAGDHVQVLVNGYNLTGDSNKVMFNDTRTMLEATSFGDSVQKFIPGQRKISIDHSGYFEAAAGRSHPVLRANDVSGVVSVLLGQNTAPAVGDPVYSLSILQGKYMPKPQVGQILPFNANFVSTGATGGWGVALTPPVSITNTTTGTGVDGGAATTKGGGAYLHILTAVAGDTYSIIVEGATNAGFSTGLTTLATFSLNGSAVGSQHIALSGTIPRYMRYKATRTGSAGNTLQLAVTLVRF